MSTKIANAILRSVSTTPRIVMNIQKVENTSTDVSRVVVHVPTDAQYLRNDAEVATTIGKKFDNKLRYLAKSLSSTGKRGIYTMFVRGNIPFRFGETASDGLIEIAANVFKDPEDCIWTLSEDASGMPIYVRSDVDDFTEVLNAARSANIVTASLEVATSEDYSAGNVVGFYDVASESQRIGIAVNSKEVFVPDTDNIVPVAPIMVLAATTDTPFTINLDNSSKRKVVLDYFRMLYGNNAEYFGRLKTLIESNLSI